MPARKVMIKPRQREEDLKLERLRQAVTVGRQDAEAGRTVLVEPGRTGDFLAALGERMTTSTSALSARERLTISRILRVNHAGEYGAIRIYGAQLALTGRDTDTKPFLRETLSHEREHLKKFADLMPARGARPCGALPLWGIGGSVLGLLTVGLGRNAVLTCTEAVERSVHRHLDQQLAWLAARDPPLAQTIREIQVEELGHLTFAADSKTEGGWALQALDQFVTTATEVLIWLSTYGASASMARDIRK